MPELARSSLDHVQSPTPVALYVITMQEIVTPVLANCICTAAKNEVCLVKCDNYRFSITLVSFKRAIN